MTSKFQDRNEAGKLLAQRLREYQEREDVLVLGLPRGGVVVAYEVAMELKAPLDVFLVRKLGVPDYEELAFGAIASGGVQVLNGKIVEQFEIPDQTISEVVEREYRELVRREHFYRGDRSNPEIEGKTIIIVDDGIATGSTMHAAASALRLHYPSSIVIGVPTAPTFTDTEFLDEADQFIVITTPEPFYAVGESYLDFSPVTDQEVREYLRRRTQFQTV